MALPPQTKYIVGNEACERFSFYGMRSILTLYMTNMLAMSGSAAVEVVHLFTAGIYIMPLLGAWVADRFLGRYRTILYVSLFYCLGHGVLALADFCHSLEARKMILFAGLFMIALGAGGIKPCVSAFVGDQAEEQRDSQTMTRIYAAFYWSINLGSFFSFLVIPWVRQTWGYSWAFGIPGIFMAMATFIFWKGRKSYKHRPPTLPHFLPVLSSRLFQGTATACSRFGGATVSQVTNTTLSIAAFIVIAPLAISLGYGAHQGASSLAQQSGLGGTAASLLGLFALLLYLVAMILAGLRLAVATHAKSFFGIAGLMLYRGQEHACRHYGKIPCRETRNLLRVLAVFLMIVPFWSLYDQTMSSWVLQGAQMQPIFFTVPLTNHQLAFGAEEMQSINPVLVMAFVPIVTLWLYPLLGRWGAPLRRMGSGIVLAGISYGTVAWLQTRLDSGEELCILWQCLPYFLLTISEILVSTTGLEYAYTAAGQNMKSIVSSFWFLTSALGNTLVVYLTTLVASPASTSTFLLYGSLSVLIGCLFFFVTTRPAFRAEEDS